MEVNLYSDTVTVPTPGMLAAMTKAKVGDDVTQSDPTVKALQRKMAELFGMEEALFFPSGTMANQVAINLHTEPGDKLFCHKSSHVHNYEAGGIAVHSGVTTTTLEGERGIFTVKDLETALQTKNDIHLAEPKIVVVENTTNQGGGACWDINELKKISRLCHSQGLIFHMDGARFFNALISSTVSSSVNNPINHLPKDLENKGSEKQGLKQIQRAVARSIIPRVKDKAKDYGKLFHTISICLSKGLGAPIGSVLLGTKKNIELALRLRKRMGGGMRQVGYLAAAGIYALDNHIERLQEDHIRAKELEGILKASPLVESVLEVQTNIVIFSLQPEIDDKTFIEKLKQEKIYISSMGAGKLRMVTHLGITDPMLDKVRRVVKNL